MAAAIGAGSATDGWEATLAAALLGSGVNPPLIGLEILPDRVPAGEPGAALLARLAASGIHHLAGSGLSPEALSPMPPLAPPGRPCAPAAAARLGLLLAEGPVARDRLREWCELAAAAGIRAPPWLLPALAPYRRDWGDVIEAIAGKELDWLAGDGAELSAAPADWTEGSPAERRAAFAALRQRDPDGARAVLETGFRAEKAELRHSLVSALEIGLSEADAPFLEACLDDRASGVRAAAQALLPRLTGSAFSARMAARLRDALSVEAKRTLLGGLLGGQKHALAVTLPEESPALARDGIEPPTYERPGGGRRAELLRGIVAAAPLQALSGHPPRLWIELALRSEWQAQIIEGLFVGLRRERDPAWVGAMVAVLSEGFAGRLSGIRRTDPLRETWARALRLLPDAEWESAMLEVLRKDDLDTILVLLRQGPSSLSARFTGAFLDWLAAVTRASPSDRSDLARARLLGRIGEWAWPDDDTAASAAAILARLPEDPGDTLRNQLAAFAETLALRATMRREFA